MAGWPARPLSGNPGYDAVRCGCHQRLQVELYHVADDFSEAVDLAAQNPDKLGELKLLFYAEAARYNVLPLDDSTIARFDPPFAPA